MAVDQGCKNNLSEPKKPNILSISGLYVNIPDRFDPPFPGIV